MAALVKEKDSRVASWVGLSRMSPATFCVSWPLTAMPGIFVCIFRTWLSLNQSMLTAGTDSQILTAALGSGSPAFTQQVCSSGTKQSSKSFACHAARKRQDQDHRRDSRNRGIFLPGPFCFLHSVTIYLKCIYSKQAMFIVYIVLFCSFLPSNSC